ncbi:MAG: UDP-glucose 4-epimerase GalE [Clostridiales Family XIII bacterium]|jgi:UDP-glucose 4-epimerase|nr:UDP-glucose 4-epimerase GalE [Clostridiales Family XIII bacterium]
MKILLTGGAGFIGSHTATVLIEKGYEIVILDDFSNSKPGAVARLEQIVGREIALEHVDLCEKTAVEDVFSRHKIDCVLHFAGLKAVGESVEKPLLYYENNLVGTLNLLHVMADMGVKKFVFSSSATVYDSRNPVPFMEEHSIGPVNPYGWTKSMIEQILLDLSASDPEWAVTLLRYFNPIGAHPSGLIGEDPQGIPNNLVPYVAKVAAGQLATIHIWGDDYDTPDGTGVRDYIHVMDLARGHLLAVEYLKTHKGCKVFNLGTGKGYSVKEVISAYEKACGKSLPAQIDARRAGDLATVYANVDLAEKELGFTAELGIEQMCADSWNWQKKSLVFDE